MSIPYLQIGYTSFCQTTPFSELQSGEYQEDHEIWFMSRVTLFSETYVLLPYVSEVMSIFYTVSRCIKMVLLIIRYHVVIHAKNIIKGEKTLLRTENLP